MKMIITPLGTRGTHSTPGQEFREFGHHTLSVKIQAFQNDVPPHNASSLSTSSFSSPTDTLIIDAGSGIINYGKAIYSSPASIAQSELRSDLESALESNSSSVKQNTQAAHLRHIHILITHTHLDHLYGLLHFKPLFDPSIILHIYGFDEIKTCLAQLMSEDPLTQLFPVPLSHLSKTLHFHPVSHLESFTIGLFEITPFCVPAEIHPNRGAVFYKIRVNDQQVVTVWDAEMIQHPTEFIQFASGSDAIIHDTHYTDTEYFHTQSYVQGYGHSTHQMAIKTAKLTQAKQLFCIHYNPLHTDTMLRKLEKQLAEKSSINLTFLRENVPCPI